VWLPSRTLGPADAIAESWDAVPRMRATDPGSVLVTSAAHLPRDGIDPDDPPGVTLV